MTGPTKSSNTEQPESQADCDVQGTPPPDPAIHIQHLTHSYPKLRKRRTNDVAQQSEIGPALNDLSFDVLPGEIFGILGPNGGGKTTLFRILSTLMLPLPNQRNQDLKVEILGLDVLTQAAAVRRKLGVVFQSPSLDVILSARENMTHQGHLYGLTGDALQERIDHLLDYFNLQDRKDEPVGRFSGGMRRRVELAKAILHEPKLLLLDEPSTGLDPGGRADLWAQLDKLSKSGEHTVVLTTHLMEEGDRCHRLAIISAGKLVAVDTPSNLKSRIGGDVVTATISNGADQQVTKNVEQLCEQITERFEPWVDGATPTIVDNAIHMEKPDGPAFVAELAAAFPNQLARISVGQPTLEDVFLHLTGHALWDGANPPV